MSTGTYVHLELLRTFRNKRFFIFSLLFPLALYVLIVGPNKDEGSFGSTGIPVATYYMVSMVAFGTMTAMLSSGARIATERTVGWTRQLRISPLSPASYFRTKLLTSYLMALLTMAVLYAAGTAFGVRVDATRWVEMTLLILVGLIPFGAAGIVLGHLMTPDSIGPVMGGGTSILGFLGGVWFPIAKGSFVFQIARLMPTYWLVQAGHVAVGGASWSLMGWIVIAAWTVALSALAIWVYRRDTGKL